MKISQIKPHSSKKELKNINEEDNQKEKSDDEENKKKNKSSHSDKYNSDNNSLFSKSENQSDNENENKNKIFNFKERKNTKDMSEIEEKENKEKLELINNILKTNNIPEKLVSLNEIFSEQIQYILNLFKKNYDGQPSYQILKEAKDHINFYKNLKIIKNEQKKYLYFLGKDKKD